MLLGATGYVRSRGVVDASDARIRSMSLTVIARSGFSVCPEWATSDGGSFKCSGICDWALITYYWRYCIIWHSSIRLSLSEWYGCLRWQNGAKTA